MQTLTIRNVPGETHIALRLGAGRNGRSEEGLHAGNIEARQSVIEAPDRHSSTQPLSCE